MPNYLYTKKEAVITPSLDIKVSEKLEAELGRGLKAPFELESNSAWFTLSGVDKVKQDLAILLSTPVGRRFLRPDYGSMLPYYLFKTINANLLITIQTQVSKAIQKFAPYVALKEVRVSQITNVQAVAIQITYMIAGTQAMQSMQVALGTPDNIATLPPEFFKIDGKPLFRDAA